LPVLIPDIGPTQYGGIYTPLQFLDAPVWKLKNEVFHSIVGFYWFFGYAATKSITSTWQKEFWAAVRTGDKTSDLENYPGS